MLSSFQRPPPSRSSSSSSSSSARRRFEIFVKLFLILPLLLLWLALHHRIIVTSSIAREEDAVVASSSADSNGALIILPGSSAGGGGDAGGERPIVIAYAISLIKCSDKQSSTAGLVDAAAILRHSVHRTSVRTPRSGSKYDYKMYAIVHSELASHCSHVLSDLGYEVLLRDAPVAASEIRGEYLRNNVHKEWCCGSDEFVKLYAYTIYSHPIVVHTDIDFMYHRPMDDLYDAMLMPPDSPGGGIARSRIEMEYPDARMPDNIEAYLTRDYHQVIPGRKAGEQRAPMTRGVCRLFLFGPPPSISYYITGENNLTPTPPFHLLRIILSPLSENAAFQAGFIVLKPDVRVFDQYLDIIREGNYVGGFSRENGWGGLGYGGVVGSMAMQGLPAYFYDVVRPNTTVELNGCRYNHMGADVYYDDVPNFIKKYRDLHGKCRRNVEGCEDCRKTDLDLVKNVHFTNCRKPWNCAGRSSTGKGDIDPRTADYDHCMQVRRFSSRPDPGRWGGGV